MAAARALVHQISGVERLFAVWAETAGSYDFKLQSGVFPGGLQREHSKGLTKRFGIHSAEITDLYVEGLDHVGSLLVSSLQGELTKLIQQSQLMHGCAPKPVPSPRLGHRPLW